MNHDKHGELGKTIAEKLDSAIVGYLRHYKVKPDTLGLYQLPLDRVDRAVIDICAACRKLFNQTLAKRIKDNKCPTPQAVLKYVYHERHVEPNAIPDVVRAIEICPICLVECNALIRRGQIVVRRRKAV